MATETGKSIRAIMIFKGITGAEIARKTGVTRQAISLVITGRKQILRLRKVISLTLNIPPSIWEQMDCELKSQREVRP